MRKTKLMTLLATFLLLQSLTAFAQQQPPYWNEIQAFKKQDSVAPQPANAILFVGSSSFRLWKDIQQAFPSYAIVNRGFGGSSLPDVIRYADEIIFPYQPKQILIYCGENDFASSDTVTSSVVVQRFKELFTIIRNQLPNVPVAYVSMKPSPSRWHLKEKMQDANKQIKAFLKKKKKTAFIDVWKPMLDKEGKPKDELFVGDKLHMNEKGYAIWQKKIEPYLLRE